MELRWGRRTVEDVDGIAVHVEVAGPEGAPVLGLLHGFSSGTFTWAGVAPLLVDRFRLVAWDRPPFGRSGRPAPRPGPADPYGPATVLRQGVEVLTRHAGTGSPVVLVGHSAGCIVAAELASARAFRVDGLVLLAAAFDGGPPDPVRRALSLPGAGVVGAAVLRASLLAATPAIRAVGRHRTPLSDATAAESGRLLRRPGTAAALVHLTRTWQRPAYPSAESIGGLPVLVVTGEDDRISDPDGNATLAASLGAGLHRLAGVGHAPHEQVPDDTARLVGAFVEGLPR